MTWSVHCLFSSSRSFTSRFQICDATDNCSVVETWGQIVTENSGFSIATPQILVRSQIWNRQVIERLGLRNLHADHVMMQLELKYLIGAKVVILKCWFLVAKPAQFQWSRILCDKAHCNGSVPVPTLTWNRWSWLELLLTSIVTNRSGIRCGGKIQISATLQQSSPLH
jgi:hypothetical protein